MFKTRRGLLVILILFFLGWLPFNLDDVKAFFARKGDASPPPSREVIITTRAQHHILQGDEGGGGHMHGANKPCKSEFPEDWDAAYIISTVQQVAANDNVDWKQQVNGYYVGEQSVDGIKVRVVLDREKESVITSYPVNVPRNPCPNPANDNQSQ